MRTLLALALFATTGQAATWFIATTGNDSTGTGSSGNPWKTIQRGVNAASAGDTITVADGTYTNQYWNGAADVAANSCGSDCASINGYASPVSITTSGSIGNPITITATHPCVAGICSVFLTGGLVTCAVNGGVITTPPSCFTGSGSGSGGNPSCSCADAYFQFSGSAAYWTVKGFDISGAWFDGVFINSGSPGNLIFQANVFHNIGNRVYQVGLPGQTQSLGIVGVFIGAGGPYTYDSNIFHDIGRVPSPGSNCSNSPPAPSPQVTYDDDYTHDHGLYLFSGPHSILNNIFYSQQAGWNVQTAGSNVSTMYGNTFVGGANPCQQGNLILYLTNTVTITNNIFANATTYSMDNFDTTQSGSVVSFNISCPATTGIISPANGGGSVTTGITYSNNTTASSCSFVNLSTRNFNLLAGSSAIGIGTTITDTHDFAGNPRPTAGGSGSGYDDGAYQYIASPVLGKGIALVF